MQCKGDVMAYGIYAVEKATMHKIDSVLKDDIIGRQSIAVRDSQALGLEGDDRYVFVEGVEEAIARADELFGEFARKEEGEKSEAIYKKIKDEEADAASGMGMIFG